MQPVKIIIQGDFYDSQIYRGRLYLWTFNGGLKVVKWNELVKSLLKEESDKIPLTFSFLDGNYLYKTSLIEIFKDIDFRDLLLKKFKKFSKKEYYISEQKLNNYLLGEQETPTRILPTDTEIYGNRLYFIHNEGLFSGEVHRAESEKYLVSSRPSKLWDCNLLTIKANRWPQIALSGGDQGLFELNMANSNPTNLIQVEPNHPIYQLSEKHSSLSNYTYLSVYNTSFVKNSFLIEFQWNIQNEKHDKIKHRDFKGNITQNKIFKTSKNFPSISWGVDDKIYKTTENGFEVIKVNYFADIQKGEEIFKLISKVDLQIWKGKIINVGSAYFGNIIECENALVVNLSNGTNITIPGPITRWRVFPRSLNYENQLHVIHDDRLEIISFNHDYFIDQE
ncbi:MAG: hypothetical protein IPP15_06650 [Saprospiraceae bacterium]|uniref:Uncharacterized protein n=1 Tax=Candidatus Opimibacter skivensis TaxID=2982028 RepID=A0A9D7STZ9_9BACT|nr:hypothetical protein [Candidatus Opimibacter skivensis]